MGNQSSTIDPEGSETLDIPVHVQVNRKPGLQSNTSNVVLSPVQYNDAHNNDTLLQQGMHETIIDSNKENQFHSTRVDSGTSKGSSDQNPVRRNSREIERRQITISVPVEVDDNHGNDDDEDVKATDLLQQFIPYYGQGDPANDSTVRAALSSLSIEEIDYKDEYGNTLLLLACQYRCEDLVRIMLNKGADPNAIIASGACCLHFACYRESISINIAKILLQNGANPEVSESTYGCTPLHYCAGTGDLTFCKLLLSHGAQIGTLDYYNYTCVDYAREAGMIEVERYLQVRLAKYYEQSKARNASSSSNLLALSGKQDIASLQAINFNGETWHPHIDPVSGGKYYIASRSGECLWESDLYARLNQSGSSNNNQNSYNSYNSAHSTPAKDTQQQHIDPAVLMSRVAKTRLIAFFGRHDPSRLLDVDEMITSYRGREKEMLHMLCTKYGVSIETELDAFTVKYNEAKAASGTDGNAHSTAAIGGMNTIVSPQKKLPTIHTEFEVGKSTPIADRSASTRGVGTIPGTPGGMDPSMVQSLLNDARIKFEVEREEDKQSYRDTISEKDGIIIKLQSQYDMIRKEKDELQKEMNHINLRLDRAQSQGGEAVTKAEVALRQLEIDNTELKRSLDSLKQEHSYDQNKLKSLEASMANLNSSHEEVMQREKAAADERAKAVRDMENKHITEINDMENKRKAVEEKCKGEILAVRNDAKCVENELNTKYDQYRRTKEIEMESLVTQHTEEKAKYTQELSSNKMLIDDLKKSLDEACKRADAAEAIQRSMQNEIVEARQVQQYNERLHKDLAREQLVRKRLHNEMEDLKGRIRVYVRIRPLSTSEREKNCSDAVVKDGKLSVLLKFPDQKKNYDFDQVFGGFEGNNQADIFRDTKHLIMSVVDGYNVCIFAYGQTGAGKSFTMIGAADIGNCLTEDGEFDELAGITPRAVSELFRLLNERSAQVEFVVEVQMFQLYRDALDDLCFERKKKNSKNSDDNAGQYQENLKIILAEHSASGLVEVEGATKNTATTPGEVMRIFAKGSSRRTTASTQMNAESSRSHLICSLVVRLKNRRTGKESVGKLTLVDLAGSERVDKSGAMGEMLKEAQSINKSLSALGDVIAALTTGQQHIPYRNHPLTMLMSDSIGGNAKTLMFVNTSPADYNIQESNSSLQFASRCKDITNSVSSGGGVQAAQMMSLKKELARLKKGGGKGASNLARPC